MEQRKSLLGRKGGVCKDPGAAGKLQEASEHGVWCRMRLEGGQRPADAGPRAGVKTLHSF